MNKVSNAFIASAALVGLAIGSTQAVPLDIDTDNVDLNLTVGTFDPGFSCVSEIDCSFDFIGLIDSWTLAGGSGGAGAVTFGDLFTEDGSTLDPPPFGYFRLDLDDGSSIDIDLFEFGTDASFSVFEFIGTMDAASTGVGAEFLSFGDNVGIVLSMAFSDIANTWNAEIVNIRSPDIPPDDPPDDPPDPPAEIPEPSTLLLLGIGLLGIGFRTWRFRAWRQAYRAAK